MANIYPIIAIEFTRINAAKILLVSSAVVLALALVLVHIVISEDVVGKKSSKVKQIMGQLQK